MIIRTLLTTQLSVVLATVADPASTLAELPQLTAHWKLGDHEEIARDSAASHRGKMVGTEFRDGRIDEVKIWNHALTGDQIKLSRSQSINGTPTLTTTS